ncbi:hypothetical protein HDV03_002670 [Kappamyces sp. JEL0829]|nr:hypothetical protein HDV03_002670 [Kappamyces sp. JEL0829]
MAYSLRTFASSAPGFISTGNKLIRKELVEEKAKQRTPSEKYCSFYQLGYCQAGESCKYVHDPARRMACHKLLSVGSCPNGPDCKWTHELTPFNTPACLYYQRPGPGCTMEHCRFAHVKVDLAKNVCRDLVRTGYCELGTE